MKLVVGATFGEVLACLFVGACWSLFVYHLVGGFALPHPAVLELEKWLKCVVVLAKRKS